MVSRHLATWAQRVAQLAILNRNARRLNREARGVLGFIEAESP